MWHATYKESTKDPKFKKRIAEYSYRNKLRNEKKANLKYQANENASRTLMRCPRNKEDIVKFFSYESMGKSTVHMFFV